MAKRKDDKPRFEIRTPTSGFNGERSGVKFVEGVGFTDDEQTAEALAGFGYAVSDNDQDLDNCCFKITGTREQLARARGMGVQLVGDYAVTNDGKRAHACLELGCEVIDVATGKAAWPSKPQGEITRGAAATAAGNGADKPDAK